MTHAHYSQFWNKQKEKQSNCSITFIKTQKLEQNV